LDVHLDGTVVGSAELFAEELLERFG
jgi:hypothetical protein